MKNVKLKRVRYSPGYCDMMGACHGMTLEKNDSGWVFICRDREEHSMPTVVTVYEAGEEAVLLFEKFLNENKVLSLAKRPASSDFVTDYSPWSYEIDFQKTSFGKTVRKYCSVSEYRKYSKKDIRLLKELNARFTALRGGKISETVEEDR